MNRQLGLQQTTSVYNEACNIENKTSGKYLYCICVHHHAPVIFKFESNKYQPNIICHLNAYYRHLSVRSEFCRVILKKVQVVWNVAFCCWASISKRFKGQQCLHLQGLVSHPVRLNPLQNLFLKNRPKHLAIKPIRSLYITDNIKCIYLLIFFFPSVIYFKVQTLSKNNVHIPKPKCFSTTITSTVLFVV